MISHDDEIYDKFFDVIDFAGLSWLLSGVDAEDTGLSAGMSPRAESENDNRDIMNEEFVKSTIKLMQTLTPDDKDAIIHLTSE